MEQKYNIPEPVSIEDKYFHAMLVRLDALCHMMSNFLEVYANQHKIPTQENEVVDKPARTPRTKK